MSPITPFDIFMSEYSRLLDRPVGQLTEDERRSLAFYSAEVDQFNGALDSSVGVLVENWTRNLRALENYVERTGTFPRDNRRLEKSAFSAEHRLLITWVNGNIREIALGNRCSFQIGRLNLVPGFHETARPVQWQGQCEDYQVFMSTSKTGAPSSRAVDPDERRLANWRARQRAMYRRGSLDQWQIEQIEWIPGWSW